MVSMYGRGFDSRQLHDQAENNHPRQGVFVFLETVKSSLLKGLQKNKKPCAAWWLFSICRTEAKGSTQLLPPAPQAYLKSACCILFGEIIRKAVAVGWERVGMRYEILTCGLKNWHPNLNR